MYHPEKPTPNPHYSAPFCLGGSSISKPYNINMKLFVELTHPQITAWLYRRAQKWFCKAHQQCWARRWHPLTWTVPLLIPWRSVWVCWRRRPPGALPPSDKYCEHHGGISRTALPRGSSRRSYDRCPQTGCLQTITSIHNIILQSKEMHILSTLAFFVLSCLTVSCFCV